MYNDESPSIWFNWTVDDTDTFTHPINGKRIFCRAIRASTACTLKVRCKGFRKVPDDTNDPAVTANDQTMLFAAGETRAVEADMIYLTDTTLNSAVLEIAY